MEILENLNERWTAKELMDFHKLMKNVVSKIEFSKVEFQFSNEKLGIRKAIIHRNVSLYFKVESDKIYLVTFFNNRMNPETLKKLLNDK